MTIRCTGCCRERWARARPSSRCARCSPSSTPAGRQRCWRRPRCWPSSTTVRSPSCSARSRSEGCSAVPTTARGSLCSPGRSRPPYGASMLLDVVTADAGIVVGTHALIQDKVDFHDLGLVVVDEQHRFGVEQRDALRAKAKTPPHLLVMTATPIPRTVAMTVFGDLEVSTLTELPAGRSPITSHVVPVGDKPHFLERAWQRIREEVAAGHQAFVVTPRIGDDEGAEESTGDDVAPDRRRRAGRRSRWSTSRPSCGTGRWPDLRLEVLHGRLPSETKEDVMRRFAAGEIDVVVATTVIEVGVDVPNATVMVVMDADRFGVSQLHQLRGRIGRGSAPGPVPARHRCRGRVAGPRTAGGRGGDARRLRALAARPGDPPGGRRARCLAVGAPVEPAAAQGDPARGRDRASPRGRHRGGGRRPGARGPPRAARARRAAGRRRAAPTTWTRRDHREKRVAR